MSSYQVIMIIMAVFFVIGAIDRCLGNRLGMGAQFEEGFFLMGKVALSIMGMICLAPALADLLEPIVVPFFNRIKIDAAMFPSMILSPDSGGWDIARELSEDVAIADFSGLVVGAVIGGVVSFAIPAAVGLISKEDTKYLAVGIMASFIVDPIGCFVGGLVQGLPVGLVIRCLLPVTVEGLLLAVGLATIPHIMIRGFQILAKFLLWLMTFGLILGATTKMTGYEIISGLCNIEEAFKRVGAIALLSAGTLPLIYTIKKVAKKPLEKLSVKTGIDSTALSFSLAAMASILPGFTVYHKMNVRGKIFLAGVTASAANMLGPHLGFVSNANPEMIIPMMAAKIIAGVLAIPLALWFGNRLFKDELAAERAAQAAV